MIYNAHKRRFEGDYNMQAGYFRWEPSSPNVKKLNALACKDFGIELVFFGPDDVDMEKEQIHGEVYQDNIWQKKTVPIPSLINNTPFKSKNERLFNFLGDRAHFMFQSFGGKRKEYKILKDEKTLEDVLIANVRIKNIQHVQDFIAEHGKVIFKPLQKKNQQMMFTLEKQNNEYILEDGKQKSKLAAS